MLIENLKKIALLDFKNWPYKVSTSISGHKVKFSVPHTTAGALFRRKKILFRALLIYQPHRIIFHHGSRSGSLIFLRQA